MRIKQAQSYNELEIAHTFYEVVDEIFELVYKLDILTYNILNDNTKDNFEKEKLFNVVIDDLANRISKLKNTKDEKSSFKCFKSNGKFFGYGIFSNNILDRDGEIITEKAHKDYVSFLKENESEYPELWLWHLPETKFTNKAKWVDFADGFMHGIWELTEEEYNLIEKASKNYNLGMSHGFNEVSYDKSNNKLIISYKTFEASILPIKYAANIYTKFQNEGKETKMFSEEQFKFLSNVVGEDLAKKIQESSDKSSKELDAKGVIRKDYQDLVEKTAEKVVDLATLVNDLQEKVNTLQKSFDELSKVKTENQIQTPQPKSVDDLLKMISGIMPQTSLQQQHPNKVISESKSPISNL